MAAWHESRRIPAGRSRRQRQRYLIRALGLAYFLAVLALAILIAYKVAR